MPAMREADAFPPPAVDELRDAAPGDEEDERRDDRLHVEAGNERPVEDAADERGQEREEHRRAVAPAVQEEQRADLPRDRHDGADREVDPACADDDRHPDGHDRDRSGLPQEDEEQRLLREEERRRDRVVREEGDERDEHAVALRPRRPARAPVRTLALRGSVLGLGVPEPANPRHRTIRHRSSAATAAPVAIAVMSAASLISSPRSSATVAPSRSVTTRSHPDTTSSSSDEMKST